MAHELKREAFKTKRNLDFFTQRGLEAETGHGRPWWAEVAFKELVDNGADAAETAGVAPNVIIVVDQDSITVTDNGVGMPVETIQSLTSFDVRVSTNAKYIAPMRGSQGNALLTLFALPYVVDGEVGRLDIETGGELHEITVKTDPIQQEPVAKLSSSNGRLVKTGTSVKLLVPKLTPDGEGCQFLQMATGYGLFNPHLTINLDAPQGALNFEATNPQWGKWLPTLPTSIHWYDLGDFISLITACIAHDRQLGSERTVRELISTFNGLSSSKKQKAVLDAAGLSRGKLSVLVPEDVDREAVARLLDAMKENAREVKPSKLGVIGEAHLRQRFNEMGSDESSFRYKRIQGVADGMPYVFEAAFACRNGYGGEERLIASGVNWSPALDGIPFDDIGSRSLEGILGETHCGEDEPILIALHLTTPNPRWTDRGKSRMPLGDQMAKAVRTAVKSVTQAWTKQRRSEDRDVKRRNNRKQEMSQQKRKADYVSLIDAIHLELDSAIAKTSGGGLYRFDARTFFYNIRPAVQKHNAEKTLEQSYLDKVLKKHQREYGVIDLMMRDPRGYLIEPHTGNVIPLGTRNVEAYAVPAWLFHTVLYIEKKGMADLLRKSGIAEKYDIAIIAAEGYATDAAKLLMSKATEQEITLLCLHDADPWGQNIYRNLEVAGLRSDNITVVDIGMGLDEAIEMGLDLEVFHRVQGLPKRIEMTDTERLHWEGEYSGEKDGKKQYRCQRIELNALAATPQDFIDFVEAKLELHGLTKNLVPPDDVVLSAANDAVRSAARHQARNIIEEMIDIESLLGRAVEEIDGLANCSTIQSNVSDWGAEAAPESWRDVTTREAEQQVRQHRERIEKIVRESLGKA
jgi:DNA topoisomerase VI subunit B